MFRKFMTIHLCLRSQEILSTNACQLQMRFLRSRALPTAVAKFESKRMTIPDEQRCRLLPLSAILAHITMNQLHSGV